jgi:hypothetical protein
LNQNSIIIYTKFNNNNLKNQVKKKKKEDENKNRVLFALLYGLFAQSQIASYHPNSSERNLKIFYQKKVPNQFETLNDIHGIVLD